MMFLDSETVQKSLEISFEFYFAKSKESLNSKRKNVLKFESNAVVTMYVKTV